MNDQEKWLDKHTISCGRFAARLTPEACRRYASENPDACASCAHLKTSGEKMPKVCTVDGCERAHYAKGFCRMHYAQKRFALGVVSGRVKGCAVAGCHEPHSAKGYCKKHYARLVTHPKQARQRKGLKLTFSGRDARTLERLVAAAKKNGTSPEAEAIIYIEACLDYYEEQQCTTNA